MGNISTIFFIFAFVLLAGSASCKDCNLHADCPEFHQCVPSWRLYGDDKCIPIRELPVSVRVANTITDATKYIGIPYTNINAGQLSETLLEAVGELFGGWDKKKRSANRRSPMLKKMFGKEPIAK